MKFWLFIIFNTLVSASATANVSAYFNQNQKTSYVDPYRNISRPGDNLESVLLKEIATAKKTIFIAVQELRLPLLSKALIAKKNEGVDVRIVLENKYNFTVLTQKDPDTEEGQYEASKAAELRAFVDTNKDGKYQVEELEARDAIYMLREAGIPMMDDSFDNSLGSGLMHHKFMIIDGRSTVISTANFTMSCIHGDTLAPSSRGNANSMIVVQSQALAKVFLSEFSQLWGNGKVGSYGQNKTYRGPITTVVQGTKITVQFSPTSQRYMWEESTNGLISSALTKATKSIKSLLFVFSDQRLADTLEKSSDMGVRIGVFIEPNFAFREYSELLDLMGIQLQGSKCTYEDNNRPWVKPAQEVGMAKLPEGDVLHHKFAVIDDKTVVVGSQNWSHSANYVNDEMVLVIQNNAISEQYAQEYERVKRTALVGPPAWLKTLIKNREEACAFYLSSINQ